MPRPFLAVYCGPLSHAITCIFPNIFKFCTFLPKFSNNLPFFTLFCPFSEKLHARMPLLSKIDPVCVSSQCILYWIHFHIKKHYFIYFFACFQNCRIPSVYPQTTNKNFLVTTDGYSVTDYTDTNRTEHAYISRHITLLYISIKFRFLSKEYN